MQRTLRTASLVATLIATLAMPLAARGGGPVTFTFYVNIGSSCMQGYGPASSTIELTLLDRNNVVIDTDTVQSDGSGYWNQQDCFWYNINGSDKVRAESGPDSRTFQIPIITTAINRVTDVVSGRAPANATLDIFTRTCPPYTCNAGPSSTVNVAANGTFSKDYTSLMNLRGRDQVQVRYVSPSNDQVYGPNRVVPFMSVVIGENRIRGEGRPQSDVTVKLKTAGGTLLAMGSDHVYLRQTNFSVDLFNASDQPVYPRVGNKLTGDFASDASLTIPNITLTHDSDSVSGHCFPNSWAYVYLQNYDPSYEWTEGDAIPTNANGNFTLDIADSDNPSYVFSTNDRWEVDCMNKKGDIAALYSHF